jgi:Ribonuclease G/E
METIAINFLRRVEEICRHSQSTTIGFTVGQELGDYLKNNGKIFLNNLKKVYSKELVWKIDPNLSLRRYSIVGVGEDGIRESIDKIE